MGAFGTAFTLATNIDVLPMIIYTEFTLSANIAMAAALSVVLGLVTWILLVISRSLTGGAIAAAGERHEKKIIKLHLSTDSNFAGLRIPACTRNNVNNGGLHRQLFPRHLQRRDNKMDY
jgi:putative spermidine/putrescine transport system permease protein